MKNILFDLAEKAKKTPNKAAFIFLNRNTNSTEINQISFKELDEKSSRAATLLSREGFHNGIVTMGAQQSTPNTPTHHNIVRGLIG